jgi:hypothetical protein
MNGGAKRMGWVIEAAASLPKATASRQPSNLWGLAFCVPTCLCS